MVSTTEGFTDKSTISSDPSVTVKNSSASKSLRKLPEVLNVKQNTAILRLGAAKSNSKTIISGSMLW